jgi:hypothetical protein
MAKKKQIKLDPEIIKGIRKQLNFLHDEKKNLKLLINLLAVNHEYFKFNINKVTDTLCNCITSINEKIEDLQVHIPIND